MATTGTDSRLKLKDRVVVTRDLGVVPEGAAGRIKVSNGLTWTRYWIQFDTGQWIGSVSADDVVREDDWEEYKRRRAEEALRPKEVAPEPSASSAGDGGGEAKPAGGADSKVPAHLLERSRQARERRAATG